MTIVLVAYFLVPPQDFVPYVQRVVRVMGAAALRTCMHAYSGRFRDGEAQEKHA